MHMYGAPMAAWGCWNASIEMHASWLRADVGFNE